VFIYSATFFAKRRREVGDMLFKILFYFIVFCFISMIFSNLIIAKITGKLSFVFSDVVFYLIFLIPAILVYVFRKKVGGINV
jgi:hypothetical protein